MKCRVNDNEIYLRSLGKSKKIPEGGKLTEIAGTPGYMAPEILKNEPYDTSADIFSLGCLLF